MNAIRDHATLAYGYVLCGKPDAAKAELVEALRIANAMGCPVLKGKLFAAISHVRRVPVVQS